MAFGRSVFLFGLLLICVGVESRPKTEEEAAKRECGIGCYTQDSDCVAKCPAETIKLPDYMYKEFTVPTPFLNPWFPVPVDPGCYEKCDPFFGYCVGLCDSLVKPSQMIPPSVLPRVKACVKSCYMLDYGVEDCFKSCDALLNVLLEWSIEIEKKKEQ